MKCRAFANTARTGGPHVQSQSVARGARSDAGDRGHNLATARRVASEGQGGKEEGGRHGAPPQHSPQPSLSQTARGL